jgi:O-antigen/teichoic acid export membrane protein
VISRIVTVRIQLRLIFSYEKVKELFRFGYKILLASLLNSFYTSYRTLFIGLYYDSESLGYFNRGEEIPRISANTIDGSIQAVMLPTYSKLQNDQIKLKSLLRKSIRMSTYIVIPMMFILAVVSEDLVMLLLTEKWINSSIFMSIFSISFAFRPIYSSNREAITAIGRSDVYLRITIIQLLVSVLLLAITLQINLVVAAIGLVISEIFSCILTGYYVYRLLSYKFSEQLKDITKNLFVGILMLTSLHFFRNYFIGVIIYLSLSVLFMRNDFFQDLRYFADIIRSR